MAIFALQFVATINGVTLVYNMRVRNILSLPRILERYKNKLITSVVPLYYHRSSKLFNATIGLDGRETRNVGGAILDLHYAPDKNWWFEATTAVAIDHGVFTGTDSFKASRGGLDDFVLSTGYRHFWGSCCQFVAYGLAGFPTKTKVDLIDRHTPLLGTRLFSLGVGGEASYSFINKNKRSLNAVGQIRVIHGFNRKYDPVLPSSSSIQPGNVTDLLFTLQYRERKTFFEVGYNPTFFSNAGIVSPVGTIKADTIIRHGGYFSLSHAFLPGLFNKTNLVGLGISANHASQIDSTVITTYAFLSIAF